MIIIEIVRNDDKSFWRSRESKGFYRLDEKSIEISKRNKIESTNIKAVSLVPSDSK